MAVYLMLSAWLASPAHASRTHLLALRCQVGLTISRTRPQVITGDRRLDELVTATQAKLLRLEDRIWVLEVALELNRLKASSIDPSTQRELITKGTSLIHSFLQILEPRVGANQVNLSKFKQRGLWHLREAIADAEDAQDLTWPSTSYSPPKTHSTD